MRTRPNASGKLNLLDALLFLQRIAFGCLITAAIADDAELTGIRGRLEWVVRKPEHQFILEVVIQDPNMENIDYRYSIAIAVNGVRAEQRNIDVIVTTHNPAVLDALGSQMAPFLSVVHRDIVTEASTITLLEDIDSLLKLMAGGALGRMATQGQIESALRAQVEG